MESGKKAWRYAAGIASVTTVCGALLMIEGSPVRYALAIMALGFALAGAALHTRWRRGAARCTALLATTCVGAVGADLALRAATARDRCNRPLLIFSYRWPKDPAVRRLQPNVQTERMQMGDLVGLLGDSSVAEPRTVRFVSDRYGFRNEGLPARPLDVVMLGDSFGMGDGTTQQETWTAHLSRAGVEVYNLSHPGSPGQHVLNLAWEAPHLPLRPNTVVVWALFGGNDLWEDYPGRATPATRSYVEQLETLFTSYRKRSPLRLMTVDRPSPARDILVLRRPGRDPVLFHRPYLERAALTTEQLMQEPSCPQLLQSFAFMKQLAEALDVRVLVAIVPSKEEVHAALLGREAQAPTPFTRLVTPLAASMRFEVLDLGPTMFAEARERGDAGPLLYWRDDTHWNDHGHALAARTLLARLRELGVAPAPATTTK